MNIRVKLYASLGQYLPSSAERNEIEYEVTTGARVTEVLDTFMVPQEMCHLVLVNGNYLAPSERDQYTLNDNDHLAVWPPVAGG